jgi:hypothetical protein
MEIFSHLGVARLRHSGLMQQLDATPAIRKPAADAATPIRLLLKSNLNPESDACRIQSLQLQLERIPP